MIGITGRLSLKKGINFVNMGMKDKYGRLMTRKRKKMALYEVFSKSFSNSRRNKNLQQLRPPESPEPGRGGSDRRAAETTMYGRKPKIVQLNRGRLEVSLPYQLAIAIGLAVVLLALASYRVGQHHAVKGPVVSAGPAEQESTAQTATISEEEIAGEEDKPSVEEVESALPDSGSNRIVIQTWKNEAQLIPVQAYFNGHGIETEIRKIGQVYYLVTAAKYNNPQRPDTDGYRAKQRIVELGVGYEPPAGYGSFDFKSAYGMKFDD